ncbi:MAG: hypothetical protein ABSG82_05955 [Sedimentisphaerales bacterium]|jgi:hypothetical protein
MGGENQISQILDPAVPGFPKIFRTFRMAVQPSKLIIALGLIAATALAGWIMDLSKTVVTTPGTNGRETELDVYMTASEQVSPYIEKYTDTDEHAGVFSTMWGFAHNKFHGVLKEFFAFNLSGILRNIAEFLRAVKWAIRYHAAYCVIFGLVTLCLVSIAGGAICRIAALQIAQDEKPGITEAMRFSTKRFASFFSTPFVPAAIIALAGACISFIGLAANIPLGLGELIVGILMPLALLGGAIIAVVLVWTIAGFNLMFPAVAYDGSTGLDAVSRSFNYVCVRPWRMGFYTIIAFVYGAICYIFVRFFAYLLLWATYKGLRLVAVLDSARGLPDKIAAIWPEPSFGQLLAFSTATGSTSEWVAAILVYLSALIVVGLVVSFIISFYFSANTIVYALMRNKVDNTPLEEIYIEPEETIQQPGKTEK